ncbi:hypothetical protein LY76DRAFT_88249 [Colletotrichum caudatum]|nr:hypothetical protein LY76DRAFT_88249 [Colletotrichum caudatum]
MGTVRFGTLRPAMRRHHRGYMPERARVPRDSGSSDLPCRDGAISFQQSDEHPAMVGLRQCNGPVLSRKRSWYSLFKERMPHLLPPDECHTKLIRALFVDQSEKRERMRNVGVRFQFTWTERLELQRSSDTLRGWVRKDGAKAPIIFTKGDQENLEKPVMRELADD